MQSTTVTTQQKLTTARVQRVCQSSTWRAGCGRIIKPGEKYLPVRAPGLSDFGVCAECATPKVAVLA